MHQYFGVYQPTEFSDKKTLLLCVGNFRKKISVLEEIARWISWIRSYTRSNDYSIAVEIQSKAPELYSLWGHVIDKRTRG